VIVLFMWIPPLRHIRQQGGTCAIAAAAIAAGVSYEEAAAQSPVPPGKRGLYPHEIRRLLSALTQVGWLSDYFFRWRPVSRLEATEEPLVLVIRPAKRSNAHCIVLKNGYVYDPAFPACVPIGSYCRRDWRVLFMFRAGPISTSGWVRDRLMLVGCALLAFVIVWIPTCVIIWLINK
jgi:hypothetical protein